MRVRHSRQLCGGEVDEGFGLTSCSQDSNFALGLQRAGEGSTGEDRGISGDLTGEHDRLIYDVWTEIC